MADDDRDRICDTHTTPRAIPLTTAWSFPTDCTETIRWIQTCPPPSFAAVYTSYGYYSPGVCFEGYTVGCVPASTVTTVNCAPIRPSETVAFCVPSGFVCDPWGYNKHSSLRMEYAAPTLQTTLWGTAIQIRWQSSDSAALGSWYDVLTAAAKTAPTPRSPRTTTEPSPLATSTGNSSGGPASGIQLSAATGGAGGPTSGARESAGTGGAGGPTPGAAQNNADKGGGLSPGSIAAIVLGVAIVVLASLLVAFFLLRRKRKQRAAGNNQGAQLGVDKTSGTAAELGLSVVQKTETELAATQPQPPWATELGVQAPRTPQLGLTAGEKTELPAPRLEPAVTELETQAPRIPELPGWPVVAPVELHTGQGRMGRRGES